MWVQIFRVVPLFLPLEFLQVIWVKMGTDSSLHAGLTSVGLTDFTHIACQRDEVKGRNNHKELVLCCLHLIKYTDTIINQSYVLMVYSQRNI